MSRYLPVDTFNTGTIAAGASLAINRYFGLNALNVVKIKVTPSGSSTGYGLKIFKDAARTKELFSTKDQVVGFFYAPTTRSGGEALEGFVVPYEDLDAGGNLHLYLTNRDSVSRNYDFEITCEAPAISGSGGTYEASGTTPGYKLYESDVPSNEKRWDIVASGSNLLFRTRTDVDGAGVTFLNITGRSGTAVAQASFLNLDVSIPATKKLFLDGGGDTYLHEVSANVAQIVAGGAVSMNFYGNSVAIAPTNKLYFDGASDTYIYESSANILSLVAGGTVSASFYSTAVEFSGSISNTSNILSIQRGTTAQTLRIYGTTTGPKYLDLIHDGSDGYARINNDGLLQLGTNGATRWNLAGSAGGYALYPSASYALGASGARLSNVFTNILSIGGTPATSGEVRLPNSGFIKSKDLSSGNVSLIGLDGTLLITVGDPANNSGMIFDAVGGLYLNYAQGDVDTRISTQATTDAFTVDSGLKAGVGSIIFGVTARLKGYTVALLPAGIQGDIAYVTDATAPTYLGALTGGGAVRTPVMYNGSAWVSC